MLPVFTISCFITAISSLIFGCFVVLDNFRIRTNKLWFLTTLSIALWSFSLGMEISSSDYSTALFWNKILNVGAIFIPIFFYHFVTLFLEINKSVRGKTILIIGYCFALFFTISNFSTKLFAKGVPPGAGFKYWIEVGPIYYLFFSFFIVYLLWSGFLLLQKRKTASIIQKRQIDYILVALLFGAGGGVTNFFPQLFNIYPFGNYLVILYTAFISYAALQHNLFNVKVIATELLTFALWILLLIKFLSSNAFQDFLLNGGLLLAVIVFGILLIRSISREVKQREQIEKMAEEVKRAYIVEKHAKEQTEKAYEVEKKANDDLKKLDEYKNSFIRQTQHDLRTPLTIMMGYSDMLLGGYYGKLSKKAADIVKRMQSVTQDKLKDINNFLDLEQFKLGKGVVALKPGVELMPILEEVTSVLLPKAEAKGIYYKLEKPEKQFTITADREKIKAAIFNVIDNAVKYTVKGGVTINIKDQIPKIKNTDSNEQDQNTKPTVVIKVKDTGIGIPKDSIKSIFEEQFERTKRAEKIAPGSGVGLCLSSQIIKLHKGKIWAESEDGKGSAFYIELPAG